MSHDLASARVLAFAPAPSLCQPPPPYPLDALGPDLAAVVRAIVALTQTPVEMAAQAVLSVVALGVQTNWSVRLPSGDIRPTSCFFLTVAESGERKSSVAGLALVPVRAREERLACAAPREERDYRARLQAWRLTRALARRDALNDVTYISPTSREAAAIDDETKFLARRPRPFAPRFLCTTSTALADLADQLKARPSLLLFSEAAAQFLGHAVRAPARRATAAFLRDIWDAGFLHRGRGRALERVCNRRLSIHLTAPLEDAKKLLTDPVLAREGALARFLVAAPVSTHGRRPWREMESDPVLDDYAARMAGLLVVSEPPADVGEVITHLLNLTPDARALWIAFADEMETAVAPGGPFALAPAVGGRLAQHAARLAALLVAYDDPRASTIAARWMEAGITLARWYGAEMRRLLAMVAPPADPVRDLLRWLHRARAGRRFQALDIYREGPPALRRAAQARAALKVLERHGRIRAVGGVFPHESWEINDLQNESE